MKIALITYNTAGKYNPDTEEDRELSSFLKRKGLDVDIVIWNDPAVSWSDYEVVILKSPWDYHEKFSEFLDWLDLIERLNITKLNPVKIVRWNLDKHYLRDISEAGLAVIQTDFLEQGSAVDLEQYFTIFNTHTLIVKPAVSGGSKNTFKFNKGEAPELSERINVLLKGEAFMVQPFVEEIQTEGEWSMLFFNGKYSHCILKKPQKDEFRVQNQFGGSVHPQMPSTELLDQAEQYVKQFAQGCLYCRVDGVRINGVFHLMELELIEPSLFLAADEDSFERYFQALNEIMNSLSASLHP